MLYIIVFTLQIRTMWEKYKEYTIAIILNIIAGIVVFIIAQSKLTATLFLLFILIITFLSLKLVMFMRLGFRSCVLHRRELPSLMNCIDLANSTLDYLGVIPIAHLPQTEAIDHIEDKARRGSAFRLLLLDPASQYAEERRKDGGAYTAEQMAQIIEDLLKRKAQLGENGHNLRVAIYNTYPIWCLGIINNDKCFLSFYGKGKAGVEWPALLIEKGGQSYFEACHLQFEKLWEQSTELMSSSDFKFTKQVVEPDKEKIVRPKSY